MILTAYWRGCTHKLKAKFNRLSLIGFLDDLFCFSTLAIHSCSRLVIISCILLFAPTVVGIGKATINKKSVSVSS